MTRALRARLARLEVAAPAPASPAQREIERLRAEIDAILLDPVAVAEMDRVADALAEQIWAADGLVHTATE